MGTDAALIDWVEIAFYRRGAYSAGDAFSIVIYKTGNDKYPYRVIEDDSRGTYTRDFALFADARKRFHRSITQLPLADTFADT